jgi:hypothetical protein
MARPHRRRQLLELGKGLGGHAAGVQHGWLGYSEGLMTIASYAAPATPLGPGTTDTRPAGWNTYQVVVEVNSNGPVRRTSGTTSTASRRSNLRSPPRGGARRHLNSVDQACPERRQRASGPHPLRENCIVEFAPRSAARWRDQRSMMANVAQRAVAEMAPGQGGRVGSACRPPSR